MVNKCTRAFVRQLDDLGRLVLPIEWRREFGVSAGVPMELVPVADGKLVIQRYVPQGACLFCGSMDAIRYFTGRAVCSGCVDALLREHFRSCDCGESLERRDVKSHAE
jgi:transcriptional pleiotropic regulator of transition state genes